MAPIEEDLRNQITELRERIEVLNSDAEKDLKSATERRRVIDLLIMLGHLDERALKAAYELIRTGLKV